MNRMLIDVQPGEVRVALTTTVNGVTKLDNLDIEAPNIKRENISSIYKGVITRLEVSLNAAFVDFGSGKPGFLPFKEISPEYFSDVNTDDITKRLKVGQEIVVQIVKDERGSKGAALTTLISLAGKFLVLMPNDPKASGISRRIGGDERKQIRDTIHKLELPEGMGVIFRTAGVGRKEEELKLDLDMLLHYWEAIKQAAVARSGPYLVAQESDVIIRALRDYLHQNINEIFINTHEEFERAKEYLRRVCPHFIDRLKLYVGKLPLLSYFGIEKQIENAYQREVKLPSGGSIVIDRTEALTSIDVNSAQSTKGADIEETALHTNCEAAVEIARQLRIRDLGGLIVIDFIDMNAAKNRDKVMKELINACQSDRARIRIGGISEFGLLEMSRQLIGGPLSESIQLTCPHCQGRGRIRTVESLALSMIHLIQEQAARSGPAMIQLQVPLDVATYILNEKRHILNNIQQQTNVEISVIPNPNYETSQHYLRILPDDQSRHIPTYKQVRAFKAETGSKKSRFQQAPQTPAVAEFLTTATPPVRTTPPSTGGIGLFKRLWNAMFGSVEELEKTPEKKLTPQPAAREHGSQTTYPRQRNIAEKTSSTTTRRRKYKKRSSGTSTGGSSSSSSVAGSSSTASTASSSSSSDNTSGVSGGGDSSSSAVSPGVGKSHSRRGTRGGQRRHQKTKRETHPLSTPEPAAKPTEKSLPTSTTSDVDPKKQTQNNPDQQPLHPPDVQQPPKTTPKTTPKTQTQASGLIQVTTKKNQSTE